MQNNQTNTELTLSDIIFIDDGKGRHNSIEASYSLEVKTSIGNSGGFANLVAEACGHGRTEEEARESLEINYHAMVQAAALPSPYQAIAEEMAEALKYYAKGEIYYADLQGVSMAEKDRGQVAQIALTKFNQFKEKKDA